MNITIEDFLYTFDTKLINMTINLKLKNNDVITNFNTEFLQIFVKAFVRKFIVTHCY
jgi:hypothetical protein